MKAGRLNNCLIAPMPVPPRAPLPVMPKDIRDEYNEVYKGVYKRRRGLNPAGTDGWVRWILTPEERRQLKKINEQYHATPEYREYQQRLDEYHNSDEYKQYEKELKHWMVMC